MHWLVCQRALMAGHWLQMFLDISYLLAQDLSQEPSVGISSKESLVGPDKDLRYQWQVNMSILFN